MTILPTLTPDEHRKLYRRAKIFLWLGIIAGLLGILHNIHVYFDPGAAQRWGHVTHVHIGGRDFAVPDEYIRIPSPNEANARELYIWVTLPNYEPYQGEYAESKNPIPIGHRHVMVLIDDTAFTTDLAFRYNAYRNRTFLIPIDSGDIYGLHKTHIYKKRPQDTQPGLLNDLYYITGLDGKVSTFISCDRDDPAVHHFPWCTDHAFQDGRLLYNISYEKSHLPHWQEIQARIHNLVDSFSCVPITIPKSSTLSTGAKPCPHH